ncbi:MAG: nuclear transport factor 2 family protein [Steroidobacteraceae bacterium]
MSANVSGTVSNRSAVEALLRELYDARVRGELDRLCGLFAPDASLRISGSSDGNAIAIAGRGAKEVRSWLGVLVKTFRLSQHEILSMAIDGPRAAVHWRANIHSRITGVSLPTELVDIFEVREGRIASYLELFAPA